MVKLVNMKNEVELYNKFIDYLPPVMDAIRIENKSIPGCFDVYLRHENGKQLWLENKIANYNEQVSFEPSQYIFMIEHVHKYSGLCLALIGTRNNQGLYLLNLSNLPKSIMYNSQLNKYSLKDYESVCLEYDLKAVTKHESMKSVVDSIRDIFETN